MATEASLFHVRIEQNCKDRHGGRAIVATERIPVGSLILEENPILNATDYDALLQKCRAVSEPSVVAVLETMFPQGKGTARYESVIAHNWHSVDPPPVNGKWANMEPMVGLWPVASLINHSFNRPNVCRTFRMKDDVAWVQYRTTREVEDGEEILDNYLDLRAPFSQRTEVEEKQHGLRSEKDCFDSARADEILAAHAHLRSEYLQDPENGAFLNVMELTQEASTMEDPALSEVFLDFADMADQEGLNEYALNAEAAALELACKREPFSNWSVLILSRMVLRSKNCPDDPEMHKKLLELCTQHCDVVYGGRLCFHLPDLYSEDS